MSMDSLENNSEKKLQYTAHVFFGLWLQFSCKELDVLQCLHHSSLVTCFLSCYKRVSWWHTASIRHKCLPYSLNAQKLKNERHVIIKATTFCLVALDTCLAKLLGGLVIPMVFAFCKKTHLIVLCSWSWEECVGQRDESHINPLPLWICRQKRWNNHCLWKKTIWIPMHYNLKNITIERVSYMVHVTWLNDS